MPGPPAGSGPGSASEPYTCVRDARLGVVLAVFLVASTLISGVLGYAAPPAWREPLDGGRGVGFLLGFALAAAWLRGSPEPAAVPTRAA
jgi:hypothetical protein